MNSLSRRSFVATTAAAMAATALAPKHTAKANEGFKFNYLVGSCLYGYAKLEDILPEVKKAGASSIDIWPMIHGNQREQIDEMGEDKFAELLKKNDVTLGCLSQYKLGPFDLSEELRFAKRFGCHTIVVNAKGPMNVQGSELKSAIASFAEQFKPTLDAAAEAGVSIAVENHSKNIIATPDAIRWLRELCPHPSMSIALAPYHLDQDPALICDLIHFLGPSISIFYAWQHGNGSMQEQPKEKERLQLPGKGSLDFAPIVKSLQQIQFKGWTEVFMHSFPRGTALHDRPTDVTNEILLASKYLESLVI